MRIVSEDTMALIIDFQEKLVPVINGNKELLHNTQILIRGLRVLGIPMVFTQQYTRGIGITVPEIAEAAGDLFDYSDKITFSCAENEEIFSKIENSGKKNIIVCGIEAHICVLQTIIDLIDRGYQVILVENCVGSRKDVDREIGIKRAIAEGAIPATYESILFELTRVAKTEVFKEISKLIK